MKKDVIYIDIEDDITSVIEKLKASSEKIVALVPPKGSSVLQSVVNLRLLHRAADKVGKRPVIVSSNQALAALAGGIGLYVAKTLQSKPSVPSGVDFDSTETAVEEVSDDVGNLDVHEADTADAGDEDEVELSGDELAALAAENEPTEKSAKKPAGKNKKKKVPNFNSFRKKALIIGGILLLVVIVLLLIFGRTKSAIVIRAETTPVDIDVTATINASASETDVSSGIIKAQKQEAKKTLSAEFRATGEKDVGQRARGSVRINTSAETILLTGLTVPAGTRITSSNSQAYTTNEPAVFERGDPDGLSGIVVGITAVDRGAQYNGARGSASTNANGVTSVSFVNSPSGGTNKKVKVISQADVDRARAGLDQQDEAEIKKELREGFDDDMHIFEDSYRASIGEVRSEPAVGQESNEGRLTAEATYTMLAVSKDDLGAVLNSAITDEMPDKDKQRVYENGLEDATFERVDGNSSRSRYKIAALGQYGPEFDIESLKSEVSGKKIGEVRSYIQDLPGVKSVDIGLSPFWARSLPGSDRITVKLEVDESSGG